MTDPVRLCALGIGAARAALGVAAIARPALVARPWVGPAQAGGTAGLVLGRAAGARDLALGAGALLASRGGELRRWTAAGAFCDLVDTLVTVTSWRDLPPGGRARIAVLAGSGAVVGGLTAALTRR
jgi:hypothetical protein